MKLKSIIYALAYGKSRKVLVRSEGARRVKQAENISNSRKIQKTLSYCTSYGSYNKLGNFKQEGVKVRSMSAPKTFSVPYGKDINIVCEDTIDYLKLQQFAEGCTAGKGGSND